MQAAHSHQKNQWPVTNEISLIRNHDTIELRLTPSSMSGFLLDPARRDLYLAISILVPPILSGGAYRYL